jgi:hypothetical protein
MVIPVAGLSAVGLSVPVTIAHVAGHSTASGRARTARLAGTFLPFLEAVRLLVLECDLQHAIETDFHVIVESIRTDAAEGRHGYFLFYFTAFVLLITFLLFRLTNTATQTGCSKSRLLV